MQLDGSELASKKQCDELNDAVLKSCEVSHTHGASKFLTWSFPTIRSIFIAPLLSLATVGLGYLLTVSYPDSMPGPTWLVSLLVYVPFLCGSLLYRSSYIQIYALTLIVLVSIWLLVPFAVQVSLMCGIPFGIGFYLLTALSFHLWAVRFKGAPLLGMGWIIRYSCMFMITAYTVNMVYGNLVSHAIQFFRTPFILQPISIFGFGSFEFLVIFTNACLAWWIYASVTTRRIFPFDIIPGETRSQRAKKIVTNPIVILVISWVSWVVLAGIIKAAHTTNDNSRLVVATVGHPSYHRKDVPSREQLATYMGQMIREQAIKTGAKFIVTPEYSLYGNEETDAPAYCESLIVNQVYPEIAGMGLYVVIGCSRISSNNPIGAVRAPKCTIDNLAYTLSPDGKILDVYGKLQPTPGETSCYQPGVSVQTVTGVVQSGPLTFSSLICYDMDFLGPSATAADMGASLILNPANDWMGVRHHYAVLVIRAIENRVAIVKAEQSIDPAIVDPFGNILALATPGASPAISAEVVLSNPLKISWVRQQIPYWACISIYAIFLTLDIIKIYKRKYT